MIEKVLSMPEDAFLAIGPVTPYVLERKPGVFEARPCTYCDEMTFVDKLVDTDDGPVCLGCRDSKG